MKIIYVFEHRHCYKYDYNMFQMKYFDKNGNDIEIWSTVRWTFCNTDDPMDIALDDNVHYIDNIDDLSKNFERIKNLNCIFICYPYHSYSYVSFCIRKYIVKYNFKYCNISGSPSLGKQRMIKSTNIIVLSILQMIRLIKLTIKSIINMNLTMLKNAFLCVIGPYLYSSTYNFITTSCANAGFPNWIELANINKNILVHANSYDEFLDANLRSSDFDKIKVDYKIPKNYILLIDDYEIGHSDFKKFGMNLPVSDEREYLNILNNFLSIIENKLDLKVIIAEHPKSEYKNDAFNGRISIRNYTNLLIKNSSFVIVGVSTCIGLVMLYKKDFIGFYSSEFFQNTPQIKSYYDVAEDVLQCKYIDIRNEYELTNIDKYFNCYDKNIYDNYINKYVIENSGIRDKYFYEAVAQRMLSQ